MTTGSGWTSSVSVLGDSACNTTVSMYPHKLEYLDSGTDIDSGLTIVCGGTMVIGLVVLTVTV